MTYPRHRESTSTQHSSKMVYNATRNIGLIGLTQAGKTTFLTSLLDHWSNHHPSRFPLGKDSRSNRISLTWKSDAAERRFEVSRDSLASGKWLEKTLDCLNYPFTITCPKWWRNVHCVIYDVPGERLADAEILRYPKLRDWSDAIVHRLSLDNLSSFSLGFRGVYHREDTASIQWASELESAYRDMLVSFIQARIPFITPSSALVDKDGCYVPREYLAGEKDIAHWLRERSTLGTGRPSIIPLPRAFDGTAILADRQKQYRLYRKDVIKPALSTLSVCQDILVLVDIAAILTMGPSWKNQTVSFIKALLHAVAPKNRATKMMHDTIWWTTAGFGGSRVERVIFVATQSDRVHAEDRDHLQQLLEDLAASATKGMAATGRFSIEFHVVSAVVSTESGDDRTLRYRNVETDKDSSAKVSVVPTEFPDSWNPRDYNFPVTAPRAPVNQSNPPRQDGLESLTELLLNIR